jgi:hypothetical protein
MPEQTGKFLIAAGVILIGLGLALIFGKNLPIGRLPGDISIQKENFSFYFPITTSIIVSIIATLIFWLAGKK